MTKFNLIVLYISLLFCSTAISGLIPTWVLISGAGVFIIVSILIREILKESDEK